MEDVTKVHHVCLSLLHVVRFFEPPPVYQFFVIFRATSMARLLGPRACPKEQAGKCASNVFPKDTTP